jgi:beta-glucosidase
MRLGFEANRLCLIAFSLNVLAILACGREPNLKGGTATKPEARDGAWMELHNAFVDRAKKGSIGLLFLGDSITQGWGDNRVWKRYYGAREAVNFGIGGDRTQHVLWRLDNGEIDGIQPKVVVLMIGTNNIGSNTTDEIAEGVKEIVRLLRSKLSASKILLLGVFPRGEKPGPVRDSVKEINDKIAMLNGDMVTYLDIGSRFVEKDGTISREIMPDALHLSQKGYMIWADAIEPTVWKLMEDK